MKGRTRLCSNFLRMWKHILKLGFLSALFQTNIENPLKKKKQQIIIEEAEKAQSRELRKKQREGTE